MAAETCMMKHPKLSQLTYNINSLLAVAQLVEYKHPQIAKLYRDAFLFQKAPVSS
jgi:hypothetical protein